MKKLLITGAYGLVGSNICKVLERDYPDIEIFREKCHLDKFGSVSPKSFDYIIFS